MVGGRGAQTHEEAREAAGGEGKMEENGRTARDVRSLYLEKAAGRPSRRALPEPATPTLFGRPLAWKPESAPLWPSARL